MRIWIYTFWILLDLQLVDSLWFISKLHIVGRQPITYISRQSKGKQHVGWAKQLIKHEGSDRRNKTIQGFSWIFSCKYMEKLSCSDFHIVFFLRTYPTGIARLRARGRYRVPIMSTQIAIALLDCRIHHSNTGRLGTGFPAHGLCPLHSSG